jgi:hypothetical protein
MMLYTKNVDKDGRTSIAIFSSDMSYRYVLSREIGDDDRSIAWIMLNPSTADAFVNDPTVERCQRRSVALGFGRMTILNLFAYRATRPEKMKEHVDPVGPRNDTVIKEEVRHAEMVVFAWGSHGTFLRRSSAVWRMLDEIAISPWVLGFTKTFQPLHPLYVPYATPLLLSPPRPW